MRERKINETMPDSLKKAIQVFGNDLSAARKARRMSQQALAERMNIGRRTIIRMEQGDPAVSMSVYAGAAWIMGLENQILNALAPEHDPVQVRAGRFALPKRVDTSHRYNAVKTDVGPGDDADSGNNIDPANHTRSGITANDTGLDF